VAEVGKVIYLTFGSVWWVGVRHFVFWRDFPCPPSISSLQSHLVEVEIDRLLHQYLGMCRLPKVWEHSERRYVLASGSITCTSAEIGGFSRFRFFSSFTFSSIRRESETAGHDAGWVLGSCSSIFPVPGWGWGSVCRDSATASGMGRGTGFGPWRRLVFPYWFLPS